MVTGYKLSICVLLILCVGVFFSPHAISQDNEASSSTVGPRGLTLVKARMCERIQENAPENQAIVFPVSIGKVLCFSSFGPVPEETFIYHHWFHRDKFSTRVRLSLKPPRWSTFSSVHLREADKGPWRVEIRGQEGHVFRILRFSITD